MSEMEHGAVFTAGHERLGYCGWPSIVLQDDGVLAVACSGLREGHLCPYGRTLFFQSRDNGQSWTPPRVINDTPLDDRDPGLVSLGGKRLMVTWFAYHSDGSGLPDAWRRIFASWDSVLLDRWMGSHSRLSEDGGQTWGEITSTPVSAPHGPLRQRDGSLLYLGKPDYPCRYPADDTRPKAISAFRSDDEGQSWQPLGQVPPPEGAAHHNCHEPHVVELPSGKLLGMCRFETSSRDTEEARTRLSSQTFGLAQTQSLDGGQNWAPFRLLQVLGSPPHLLLHSSGALVCTYGHRRVPFGQRAIISRDEGATWSRPVVLRDDGFSVDLGYPASVELADGSIFSVYYQAAGADEKPGILWTKWSLPV